jgi:hypothetical protein
VTGCMQVFAFTAPYSTKVDAAKAGKVPVRWYSREAALSFQERHGMGVRAVGAHWHALNMHGTAHSVQGCGPRNVMFGRSISSMQRCDIRPMLH